MGGDITKPFPDLESDKNGQPDKDVKPSDEIQPEIKPKPEQFDNNTPHTKEEWFKSKWKTEKNFKCSNALKRRFLFYTYISVMLRLATLAQVIL